MKDAGRANSNETSSHRASNKMSPRTWKKWNDLLSTDRTWWSTAQEARDFAATRASIWRHRRCQARSACARSEVGAGPAFALPRGSEEPVRFGRPSSSDLTSDLRASERGRPSETVSRPLRSRRLCTRSKSLRDTFLVTLEPASLQNLAAAISTQKFLRPSTSTVAHEDR